MAGGNESNSYRNIFKGISTFGGVQVFQILINLIRGKFVALFLGPEGMGISALFTSTTNTVAQISTMGLNFAVVKEVAEVRDNPTKLALTIRITEKLISLTALAGALFTALFAPWLSQLAFGSGDYAWQFVALSVMIYFSVAGSGRLAILQGLHHVKILSKASLVGAITGLVVGVPLYYFFGNLGIVPGMIAISLAFYIFYSIGLRQVRPKEEEPKVRASLRENKPLIRRLFSLGIILLASMAINTSCTYIINLVIRMAGDVEEVGLYNAAISLTTQYSSLVFTAMSMDYFPRLTAAIHNDPEMYRIVNRQSEIVALIATPLLIALIPGAPLVIRLLLTAKFEPILNLMQILAFASLIKALASPMGYIAFAKGNKRLFFGLEAITCNALYLGCSCLGYYLYGLPGIGYGVLIQNVLELIIYYFVNLRVYGVRMSRRAFSFYGISTLLGTASLTTALLSAGIVSYILMSVLFLLALTFSLTRLRSLLRQS